MIVNAWPITRNMQNCTSLVSRSFAEHSHGATGRVASLEPRKSRKSVEVVEVSHTTALRPVPPNSPPDWPCRKKICRCNAPMHMKRSWFSTFHIIFTLFCPCSVMLCKPLPVLGTQSRCHASHGQQLLAWQWMSINLWKIMKANVIAFKDEKRPTWEKDRQESRIQPPTKTVREARKCESDEIRIQPEWQNLFGMPAGWDN